MSNSHSWLFPRFVPRRSLRPTFSAVKPFLETLEDRRLLTLAFDPTYLSPTPYPYPPGHSFLEVPGETFAESTDMVRQPLDDKMVLVGITAHADGWRLLRATTGGLFDQTFGTNGVVTQPFYGSMDPSGRPRAVAIQTDQRIVAAGPVPITPGSSGPNKMGVMRFLQDGSLDTSFRGTNDEGGRSTISFEYLGMPMTTGDAFDVTVDQQQRIWVVGTATFPADTCIDAFRGSEVGRLRGA